MGSLASLEKKAVYDIQKSKQLFNIKHGEVLLAYSGGKDALCLALIMLNAGIPFKPVCDVSWYFPQQIKDIVRTVNKLSIKNIEYTEYLPEKYLKNNNHMIFSTCSKIRSRLFSLRQQKAIKDFSESNKYKLVLFGRRDEENSVKRKIYKRDSGIYYMHPLKVWKTHQVWEYIFSCGLERPWIYGTEFGIREGNAPFYLFMPYDYEDTDYCWKYISSLYNGFNKERFGVK